MWSPAAAQLRAVAAATLVFPTPPFPVYRMVRGAMEARDLVAYSTAISPVSAVPRLPRPVRSSLAASRML